MAERKRPAVEEKPYDADVKLAVMGRDVKVETVITMIDSELQPDSRFKNPAAGLKVLVKYKDDWSEDLNSKSTQACYAIIAAAWAVYGGGSLFRNHLALAAVSIAIFHIGLTLGVHLFMTEKLTRRFWFAQRNQEKWNEEWKHSGAPTSVWPYDRSIQWTGRAFHWAKFILPFAAAIILIISFWIR